MKKREIGLIASILLIFVGGIALCNAVDTARENSYIEKQQSEQLQAEAKKAEEEKRVEEAKRAEKEYIEAQKREAERIEEERLEAERIEQERIDTEREVEEAKRKEAERLEAERVAEEKRQQEIAANNNFYVEDGKANHDTSTGYDSPDSDPNEPTITSSIGYVASGNNYMHKTTDCKFISGKATSTVDANSWSGAVCNCWYY
ncbi:hypothetical protein [Clostridium culturomicium]|uniref:hypothetical protein n=1 Tax=Clostridium culturomicium TaxID=1499683 RepID=UPI0038573769